MAGEDVERARVIGEIPDLEVLAGPSEQGRPSVGHVLELRELGGEVLERVIAGAEDGDRPSGAALDLASPQRRDQPGQGQRRLAAARRAQDGQEPLHVAGADHRARRFPSSQSVWASRPKKNGVCSGPKGARPR